MEGRRIRIRIAENIAVTPPNLFGIERRIAYAQRKYHSGLMWVGVTRGFAGMKFSGSLKILGENWAVRDITKNKMINPDMSFVE